MCLNSRISRTHRHSHTCLIWRRQICNSCLQNPDSHISDSSKSTCNYPIIHNQNDGACTRVCVCACVQLKLIQVCFCMLLWMCVCVCCADMINCETVSSCPPERGLVFSSLLTIILPPGQKHHGMFRVDMHTFCSPGIQVRVVAVGRVRARPLSHPLSAQLSYLSSHVSKTHLSH